MDPPNVSAPPQLGNQYIDDHVLRSFLRRALPPDVLTRIEVELHELGELAGHVLYDQQLAERHLEPVLTSWDAWGNRVDRIELTPLWRRAEALAVRFGLTAVPYEQRDGRYSRLHQLALVHLFHPSTDMYTCPLAMTDGAARTLCDSGNAALVERAVPRLTSRDLQRFWTSGQWMTELTGGSDVGASLTRAEPTADGGWTLVGRKWFTSAASAPMALTLARPEGNPTGGRGLALFYVETRDTDGRLQGIRIDRLKDKLGTRKLPTAELTLDGTPALPVAGLRDGTAAIEPMLRITRVWNSVCAGAAMRRGLALAYAYAGRRSAFGRLLLEQPLHRETLAELATAYAGAFSLTFALVDLVGRAEAGELDDASRQLLRLMLPITKLATGKQAVATMSEVVEAFGGAGYVEDTGLPALLRDTQVLPIWEGTTNVLALDALLRTDLAEGVRAWSDRVRSAVRATTEPRLAEPGRTALAHLEDATTWAMETTEPTLRQAGARRFALALARCMQLGLLVEHAQWALDTEGDHSFVALARRLARSPLDPVVRGSTAEVDAILNPLVTAGQEGPEDE